MGRNEKKTGETFLFKNDWIYIFFHQINFFFFGITGKILSFFSFATIREKKNRRVYQGSFSVIMFLRNENKKKN